MTPESFRSLYEVPNELCALKLLNGLVASRRVGLGELVEQLALAAPLWTVPTIKNEPRESSKKIERKLTA